MDADRDMLIILATLLAWTPAVFGYGIVLTLARGKLDADESIDVLVESVAGMFVLSVLVSGLNFFVAIDAVVSTLFVIAGWSFCLVRMTWLRNFTIRKHDVALVVLWLLFVAFWATQSPRNPDTALYHLQAIKWINQNPLPAGLANLHERLGMNSSWFSFVAVLQIPFVAKEGVNALCASAVINFFLGIAVFQSVRQIRKQGLELHSMFLALIPLLVLSDHLRRNISSPSPDYAVFVLCLVVVFAALRILVTRQDYGYRLLQLTVLIAFAITIKATAIPLIFVFLSVVWFLWKNRISFAGGKFTGYALLYSGIPFFVWVARGIALSGYINFPNSETALSGLQWTVPKPIADHVWFANQTTSKLTYPHELPFLQWIGPWLRDVLISSDFVLFLILALAGLTLVFGFGRRRVADIRWVILPLVLAVLCWFFIGPAIRFGAGYLWALGLTLLAAGISGSSLKVSKTALTLTVLLCLVSFVPRAEMINFGLPPIRKLFRNPETFLHQLPIPQANTVPKASHNGVIIRVPNDGTFDCWLSELPCAPEVRDNLIVIQTGNGKFRMFYFAPCE